MAPSTENYCDASITNAGRLAGYGGVIRNVNGDWILTFSHKSDPCLSLEADLWALKHVLSIVWGKGYMIVVMEFDSTLAISLIKDQDVYGH